MSFRYRYLCSVEHVFVEETKDESLPAPTVCKNDGAAFVANSLTIVDEPHFAGNLQLGNGDELDVTGANIEGLSHLSLNDVGTNTHSQIDSHIADATRHRQINDGGSGSTDLWSASKITTQLATKANTSHTHVASDVTNFSTAVSANTDVQASLTHAANTSNPHSVTKTQIGLSNVQNIKDNYTATVVPTTTDDSSLSYSAGSRWINTTTQRSYICVSASVGAAVWRESSITSTSNVPEGTNFYYTDTRFDTRFAAKSTTGLTEGTNLYYTDTRVNNNSAVSAATTHIANTSNPHNTTKAQIGLSNVQNTKQNFTATSAPIVTDDSNSGYSVGSLWINTNTQAAYVCVDASVGAAVWASPSAIPGGSTSQVQYNNSGSFAGAENLIIDSDAYPVIGDKVDDTPLAPSSGVKLYARSRAGRRMLAQIGPSGLEYSFQPSLWAQKACIWSAQGNGTSVSTINFGVSNSGTTTTRNVAATNSFTCFRRLGFLTSTTAGTSAGVRHNLAQFFRGNGTSGIGGFFYVARCGISSAATVSGQRSFVGLYGSTAVIGNVQPSSLTNILGFACDSTDSSWYFMHNDGSGTATKDTLTGSFPARSLSADMMEMRIFCPPNASAVYYSIQVLPSGTVFESSTGNDLPAATTLLSPQIWTNNASTALAAGIDVVVQYIETDN